MKYGIEIENDRLLGKWGGVGAKVAECTGNELLPIKYAIYQIKKINGHLKNELKLDLGVGNLSMVVKENTVFVYDYNEFEFEEELAQIDLGQIRINDLLNILEEYLQHLRSLESYQKYVDLENFFSNIWELVEVNIKLIREYRQFRSGGNLYVKIDNEINVNRNNMIAKSYRIDIENDVINIYRNRKYKNNLPLSFPLDRQGECIEFLRKDIKRWYEDVSN